VQLSTRRVLDRSFSGLSVFSVALMAAALVVLLGPIFVRGAGAFVFYGTVEWRRFLLERLNRGDRDTLAAEVAQAQRARKPVFEMVAKFRQEMEQGSPEIRAKYSKPLEALEEKLHALLGPRPDARPAGVLRDQYGQTRWDRAVVKLHDTLYITRYDYSDPSRLGRKVEVPRAEEFKGTSLEPLFAYLQTNTEHMLLPRWTFYWRFLFDEPYDSYLFGGIWPALLGTLYLTIGAMLVAGPTGIICAIYLAEYAGESRFVSLIRTCISTLAGVPSIVFGLFGLAFFLNALHLSGAKSVLAGSLTLAVLVLPTVIRASEEAIKAVPATYKEAALSLGASKWRTVFTVVLPAALPGVLTSIIISMGRAAGETAPIMFTAVVSLGAALLPWQALSQPTQALPWSIFNLVTENRMADEIRHVQYGMVMTLIVLVLLLNVAAIVVRARVSRKLRG
jgi:phosphate transport system permease protein